VDIVANFYGLDVDELIGPKRNKRLVKPRQIAMYLIREETASSLPQIGAVLGGRDHTTIMYGCDKISSCIEEDDQTRREVITLREMLYSNGRNG